eukprot:scaffold6693_cov23-Tisochrysis_lutea.AAC.1
MHLTFGLRSQRWLPQPAPQARNAGRHDGQYIPPQPKLKERMQQEQWIPLPKSHRHHRQMRDQETNAP